MNLDFKAIAIVLLMTTVNLLNMEKTPRHNLSHNFTQFTRHSTQLRIRNVSHSNTYDSINKEIDKNHENKSIENRRNTLPEKQVKYLKIPNMEDNAEILSLTMPKTDMTYPNKTTIILKRLNENDKIGQMTSCDNDNKANGSCILANQSNDNYNMNKTENISSRNARRLGNRKVQRRKRRNKTKAKNQRMKQKPLKDFVNSERDDSNYFDEITDLSKDTDDDFYGLKIFDNYDSNTGELKIPEEPKSYDSKSTAVQYWDGTNVDQQYDQEPSNIEEFKSLSLRPLTDKLSEEESKKEDKKAIDKLHDMYYCNKYCHCCKKAHPVITHPETHHEHEHGTFDRMFRAVKQYGYDPSYKFIFGRKSDDTVVDEETKHDYEAKTIVHEDQPFVFFNREEDDPSGVKECKNVCSCCDNVKRRMIKQKKKEMKKKEEKKKETLEGVTGVIKQLLVAEEKKDADDRADLNKRTARSVSYDYMDENEKVDKVGHMTKYTGMRKLDDQQFYSSGDHDSHTALEIHDEDVHDIEHHDHHDSFDCSKCCQFCEPKEERRKRKRKKEPFEAYGGLDLLDFLRSLLTGKPVLGGSSDSFNPTYTDGDFSFSVTGSSSYAYVGNYLELEPAPIPSPSSNTTCCNSTILVNTIPVVTAGLIVFNLFNAANVAALTTIPLAIFGGIVIFVFFSIQATVPAFFVPIFVILLIMTAVPTTLTLLTTLGLPATLLAPAVVPFIARLPTSQLSTYNAVNCVGVNCTTVNGTAEYPSYGDYSADIENTTVTLIDTNFINETVNDGRQLSAPKDAYSKLQSVLSSQQCLERVGCHLAVYTRPIYYYNKFMSRILGKMSVTLNNFKFTSYKDAYETGSSNVTSHESCNILYYCIEYQKYITK